MGGGGVQGTEWGPRGGGRRLSVDEGPRERLSRLGASALTDAELIALLLGTGSRGRPVWTVAEALLERGGGLKTLVTQDVEELAAMPGLGPAKAAALLAALELGRRVHRRDDARPHLVSPNEIYRYLAPRLGALRREVFHVLSLNSRNVLLRDARVAEGTVGVCPVDPREIFAGALAVRASGIVLAHNHPSGDPDPSDQDLALTAQISRAARLLSIRLLDHVIVGDGRFVSLLERRQLPAGEEAKGWRAAGDWP